MRRSHTITISIERSHDEVYAFLSKPANYASWAAVRPETFKPIGDGDWLGDTTFGQRHFRFTPHNAFGVLDHAIFVPGGELFFNPMRVTPNGDGCDLTFIFLQREGMTDSEFDSAVEWITTDFMALKSQLEAMPSIVPPSMSGR